MSHLNALAVLRAAVLKLVATIIASEKLECYFQITLCFIVRTTNIIVAIKFLV